MSQLAANIPEVVVKPVKIMHSRSMRTKTILATVALLLFVYFLMAFEAFYHKNKILNHIMEMTVETEQKMLKLHSIDQNLAMELEQLDDHYH